MVEKIFIKRRPLTLRKSIKEPKFDGISVLVNDPWEYVEMWLKRHKGDSEDAIFYWQQAKQFYDASIQLPLTSSPLTLYYCFLNATKTLLKVKGVDFTDRHGVTGRSKGTKLSLSNELVEIKESGILPSLCRYLEDDIPTKGKNEFSLKNLFYNLVFIHRSYCLTYTSESKKELFIPLDDVFFVKKERSKEGWFCAEIDSKYANGHTLNKISECFESDFNFQDKFVVRFKKRMKWEGNSTLNSLKFINYHKKIRKNVHIIAGSSSRWYIKRINVEESIPLSPLVITFASMHRLSELSRYEPITLSKHLSSQQNWLISEFIKGAPYQYINEIASEITGEEFFVPRAGL